MSQAKTAIYGLVVGLIFILSSLPVAIAQEETTPENQALAQQRYDAGKRAYDIGAFDEAIVEWKKAYQFYGAPDFLFNIAQAYRQKRDYNEAIFFFNAYLRASPTAANRGEVEALRDEMVALKEREEQMKKARPTEVQPVDGGSTSGRIAPDAIATAATAPVTETPALSTAPPPKPGASWRLGGIIAGGTGLVFAATGLAFALSAQSTEKDLESAAEGQEPWSAKLEDMEATGKRNATIGTSFLIVGGLGIAGGVAAYLFGSSKRHERTLTLVPQVEQSTAATSVGLSIGMSY